MLFNQDGVFSFVAGDVGSRSWHIFIRQVYPLFLVLSISLYGSWGKLVAGFVVFWIALVLF